MNASNMSLYDVASLSNTPSLSTAVLNAVISLSNLSGLIAILPPSCSIIILQCPNIDLCSELKLTGTILISWLQLSPNFSDLYLAITLSYSASSPIHSFNDLTIKDGFAPSMYTLSTSYL